MCGRCDRKDLHVRGHCRVRNAEEESLSLRERFSLACFHLLMRIPFSRLGFQQLLEQQPQAADFERGRQPASFLSRS